MATRGCRVLTAFFDSSSHAAKKTTRAIVLPCTGLQGIQTARAPRYDHHPALLHSSGPRFRDTNFQLHHTPASFRYRAGAEWIVHEDHFNLPACWGGTKAEAEAMRAKKAKRRIILEIVYM